MKKMFHILLAMLISVSMVFTNVSGAVMTIASASPDESNGDNVYKIECEAGEVGGSATKDSNGSASGGYSIGTFDAANASVEMTVDIANAGLYKMEVVFSNGRGPGNDSAKNIFINGKRRFVMTFAGSGDWGEWRSAESNGFQLSSGANKIKIQSNSDGAPANFDYIVLSPASSGRIECEDGVAGGGAAETDRAFASGESAVGGFDNLGSYVEMTANIFQAGIYKMDAGYACGLGNSITKEIYINGEKQLEVTFAPTPGWGNDNANEWSSVQTETFSLNKGGNTIKIQSGTAGAPANFDYIDLQFISAAPDEPVDPDGSVLVYPSPVNVSETVIEEDERFTVTVEGRESPVWKVPGMLGDTVNKGKSVSSFAFTDTVEVTVEFEGGITSAAILPTEYGIKPTIADGKLVFTLSDADNYKESKVIIRVDGDKGKELFLFGDPMPDVPEAGDGVVFVEPGNHTAASLDMDSTAGDQAAASTTVVFKAGSHYITDNDRKLSMKSGQTIYLAPGAVLHARFDTVEKNDLKVHGPGIVVATKATRLHNQEVGDDYLAEGLSPFVHNMSFYLCETVDLQDFIIVRDFTGEGIHQLVLRNTDDVTVNNVKVINDVVNSDGFTLGGNDGVTVTNYFGVSGDNNICIGWWGKTDNVLIDNYIAYFPYFELDTNPNTQNRELYTNALTSAIFPQGIDGALIPPEAGGNEISSVGTLRIKNLYAIEQTQVLGAIWGDVFDNIDNFTIENVFCEENSTSATANGFMLFSLPASSNKNFTLKNVYFDGNKGGRLGKNWFMRFDNVYYNTTYDENGVPHGRLIETEAQADATAPAGGSYGKVQVLNGKSDQHYEAENGLLNGTEAVNKNSASYGKAVGSFTEAGNSVTVYVDIPENGSDYSLDVGYANLTEAAASIDVYVDEAAVPTAVPLTSTLGQSPQWTRLSEIQTGLNLTEGTHAIKLQADAALAEEVYIDYISVYKAGELITGDGPNAGPNVQPITLAAKDAALKVATKATRVNASNSEIVTNTGGSGAEVTFTVNAEEAGNYMLDLHYANGNLATAKRDIFVGEGTAARKYAFVYLPTTWGWDTAISWKSVDNIGPFYLEQGTNKVRIYTGSDGKTSVDYDKIVVHPAIAGLDNTSPVEPDQYIEKPYAYQAEIQELTGAAVPAITKAGYIGGGYVDLTENGSGITFKKVNGGTGEPDTVMELRYSSDAEATIDITINNKQAQSETLPSTSDAWVVKEIIIDIDEGFENVVVIESTGAVVVSVDQIEIPVSVIKYECENGNVGGGARVNAKKPASGGLVLDSFDSMNAYVDMPITVPSAGEYKMAISYCSGLTKASVDKEIYINNAAPFRINLKTTGSWGENSADEWKLVETEAFTLKAGLNWIKIKSCTQNDPANFDYVVLYPSSYEFVPDPLSVGTINVTGQGGTDTITAKYGTLLMKAEVLPKNAEDKTVTWSVETKSGGGAAVILQSGLLTATANGVVTVTATANDGSEVVGTCDVTISGQDGGAKTESLKFECENGIINLPTYVDGNANASNGYAVGGMSWAPGYIEMPVYVTAGEYIVAVCYASDGNGSNSVYVKGSASNSVAVTLPSTGGWGTAAKDWKLAAATEKLTLAEGKNILRIDAASVAANFDYIFVYNEDHSPIPDEKLVEEINVTTRSGDEAITARYGTLMMKAEVLPADADNDSVVWSVASEDGSGAADIEPNGLLTATADGVVTVTATAKDGSDVSGTLVITISGQDGTTTAPIKFECEDGTIVSPANISVNQNASNGAAVGGMDWTNAAIELPIYVTAGRYQIAAQYSSGNANGVNGEVRIKTNWSNKVSLGLPNTGGWGSSANQWQLAYGLGTLTLTEGRNVLEIPQLSGGANLDYILVYPEGSSPLPEPGLVEEINVTTRSGAEAITTRYGTLMMKAEVLPVDADEKGVTWSVVSKDSNGAAVIEPNGLLTATANGVVTVTAAANDGSEVFGTLDITISGQDGGAKTESIKFECEDGTLVSPAELTVRAPASNGYAVGEMGWGANVGAVEMPVYVTAGSYKLSVHYASGADADAGRNVYVKGSTDNFVALTLPPTGGAGDNAGEWQLVEGTGTLTLNEGKNILVIPGATKWANFDYILLYPEDTDLGVPVSSISVANDWNVTDVSQINSNGGSLDFRADVLPINATDKSVEWSIASGAEYADLVELDGDKAGKVSIIAKANGVVVLKAAALDGFGAYGTHTITITGQTGQEKNNMGMHFTQVTRLSP